MSIKQKLHAHSQFILVNTLIAIIIASRYFAFLPEIPTDPLGLFFIFTGTLSQMGLLAAMMGLLALPAVLLPKTGRNIVQATVATVGIAVLFIDTLVFAQYRFHINAVVVELLLSGQVVSFPFMMWAMGVTAILAVLGCQWWLIRSLEASSAKVRSTLWRKCALLCLCALVATNGVHIWAAANAYQPVTTVKRYLPLFYPATSNTLMKQLGWIDEAAIKRQRALAMTRKSDLNYPLTPLEPHSVEQPPNILFLVIDSWRADTFNADNTPNMWQYAQSGVIFNRHMSTGNSTRTGIFGLFYGIPGTYWHGFLANQKSPLFVDRLQALNYELGIFAAAHLEKPEFNQTVFSKVDNLRIGSDGERPSELDADLTQDWLQWYANRDKSRPAFSFLFYDAPHGYDFPDDFKPRYEPMLTSINYLELDNETDPTLFLNRYKTSVRYVDSVAKQVLDKLKTSGDLDNTLVIITGDHGQEINDNRLNFWGHNSNFSDAQVNVPFAIFGPGITKDAMKWQANSLTHHQDVVPTLMKNYLGISNNIKDYSVGEDLLGSEIKRDWWISSNYSGYAIISDDSILEVGAGGQYQLLDKANRPLKKAQPDFNHFQQALEQISRFNH